MIVRAVLATRLAGRSLAQSRGTVALTAAVLIFAVTAWDTVDAVWHSTVVEPIPGLAPEIVGISVLDLGATSAVPYLLDNEVDLLREEAQSFDWIGVYQQVPGIVGSHPNQRGVRVARVDPGWFDALAVRPTWGRTLVPDDHVPWRIETRRGDTGQPVAILSTRLAHTILPSPRRGAVNTVVLDEAPTAIVGIVDRVSAFPPEVDIWVPSAESTPSFGRFAAPVAARLRDGFTTGSAAQESTALLREAGLRSDTEAVSVISIQQVVAGPVRPAMALLRSGAFVLLVLAGASVLAIRIASAQEDTRSAAIRNACGARRSDEFAVAALRCLLLAPVITVLSAIASSWLLAAFGDFTRLAGAELLRADTWPNGVLRLLPLTSLVIGTAETTNFVAVSAAGTTGGELRSGARRIGWRMSWGVLGIGVALITGVLVGTVTLGSSALDAVRGNDSYQGQDLAQLSLDFRGRSGQEPARERKLDAVIQLAEALRRLPGVVAVAYADFLPDERGGIQIRDHKDGRPLESSRRTLRGISPGFFEVLDVPVLEGRELREDDVYPGPSVVLAEASYVRASDHPPEVGDLVQLSGPGSHARLVGVVPDLPGLLGSSVVPLAPSLYRDFGRPEHLISPPKAEFLIRYRHRPTASDLSLAAAVPSRVDPVFRVLRAESVWDRRVRLLGSPLWAALALAVFAGCGVLLAIGGCIGQVRTFCGQQRRNDAIRAALGATRRDLVRRTAGLGAIGIGPGVVVGTLLGWLQIRVIGAHLLWVKTGEPVLILAPALFVGFLSLAVTAVTATRMAGNDTSRILKSP